MPTPSRQEIRTSLRRAVKRVGEDVTRRIGRFAPVDPVWSHPPDHRPYIRSDYSMCCLYHEEHSFRPWR